MGTRKERKLAGDEDIGGETTRLEDS